MTWPRCLTSDFGRPCQQYAAVRLVGYRADSTEVPLGACCDYHAYDREQYAYRWLCCVRVEKQPITEQGAA